MISAPMTRRRVDHLMLDVLLALLPGIAVTVLLFGWLPLRNLILAASAALLLETLLLRARGKRQARIQGDGSALLSGALLALCLPASVPWPLLLLGAAIAIGCKQLYGGLGQNPFNPAMVAFVCLLVLFPAAINHWPVAAWPWSSGIDAVSSATALELLRTQLNLNHTLSEIAPALSSTSGTRTALACAWLAGGLYLLWRGTIRWQIPLAVIAGLSVPATLFWLFDTEHHASPLFHLLGGATLFGAFFIATDPVTAPLTVRARWLYGCGIGLLCWLIRSNGHYPDGFAFAVLSLNLCVPLLDRHFGHHGRSQP